MRAAVVVLGALGCHHGAHPVENAAPLVAATAIAVYDRGDGSVTEVIDDRRWVDVKAGQRALAIDDVDPAAALASLVIEPVRGALRIGACRRTEIGATAASELRERAAQRILDGEVPEPTVRAAAGAGVFAPSVTCDVDGPPGHYLVRVLYVTAGLAYRAQHEVRMAAPDHATVRSTFTLATPRWHRTAEVAIFDGAPGGSHVPRALAHGQVALDGTVGAIVVLEHEVKARLRRIFDGALPTSPDIASSDIQWGEASREIVWVWLELVDAQIAPGPVHATLDLPGELARVSDISNDARRATTATDDPDGPSRLAIYADEDLHGTRQRWHDFVDTAELADRFAMAVTNTGDEPREVWIEEHLRAAKRRVVAHAWPRPPGLHGEILRSKVVVRPGKTVRVGYTVDYDF